MVDDLRDKDRKNAKASQMGGVQHVSRSGEKGRTIRQGGWGKVDCCMLEQRGNMVKALSIIYLYTGYIGYIQDRGNGEKGNLFVKVYLWKAQGEKSCSTSS